MRLDILSTNLDIFYIVRGSLISLLKRKNFVMFLLQLKSIHISSMSWLDAFEQVKELWRDLWEANLRNWSKLRIEIDRHLTRSLRFNYIELTILLCALYPKVLIQRNCALPFLFRLDAMNWALSCPLLLLFDLEFSSRAGDFEVGDTH